MSTKVITPEQFEKAVISALAEYGDESSEKLENITKQTARDTSKALKASAPSGEEYARGWSHRAEGRSAYKLTHIVYNRTRYMLVHLLEKPHQTGGGTHPVGHYPTHTDYTGTVERIEKEYTEKYIQEVMAKL